MTEHKPLHIAHLIWHFSTGGLENGVVNLINHLPETDYAHSIITLTGHDTEFVNRISAINVNFYCLHKKPGHDWGTFSRLNSLLKQLQPDVLHSRNLATLELQTVGWWRGIPLRLHGEHGWDANDVGGSNRKNRLIRRIFQRFAQRFICLSAESEHYLKRHVRLKADKIVRICNGVDIAKFSQTQRADLTALGITTDQPCLLIGTVGRLAQVKNQALLINAYALLYQQHGALMQRYKLLLVGDGPCRQQLEQLAATLQLSAQIIFAGNRSDIAYVKGKAVVCSDDSLLASVSGSFAVGTLGPAFDTAVTKGAE